MSSRACVLHLETGAGLQEQVPVLSAGERLPVWRLPGERGPGGNRLHLRGRHGSLGAVRPLQEAEADHHSRLVLITFLICCGGFKSKIYSILDQSKLNNLLKDLGYDQHVGSPEAGTGAAARMEAAATEDENSPGEGAEEAGTERHPAGAVTAGQASRTPQEETDNNNAGERSREKTKRKIILKKVGHSVVKRSDETNNNFRPNTNTNNIRFSKSTEYEYE